MARRRTQDDLDNEGMFGEDDFIRSLGIPREGDGPPGVGGIIEPAPDLSFLDKPPGGEPPGIPPALGPDPDVESGPGGNRTSPRELFPQDTPTRPPTSLPQGMTVEQSGGFGNVLNTPSTGIEPNPVAARGANAFTPPQAATTRRVSPGATSALFEQEGGSPLFGRVGGLLEGGIGVPGSDEGGPSPTEMMVKLLNLFRQQR